MEDAHATVLQLAADDINAFFAVYDGHGGESSTVKSRPLDCVISLRTL
jgi:serine/threonine protein phosphatase PrpC